MQGGGGEPGAAFQRVHDRVAAPACAADAQRRLRVRRSSSFVTAHVHPHSHPRAHLHSFALHSRRYPERDIAHKRNHAISGDAFVS